MRRLTLALFAIGSLVILTVGMTVDARWGLLLFLALVFGLCQGAQSLFNSLQVAARRRRAAALYQAMVPLSRLLGGAAAVVIAGATAGAAMAGTAVGMAVVLWSQWRSVRRVVPGPSAEAENPAAIRQTLWNYGRYFALWGVFTALQLASDTWALKFFYDESTVGLYAAAFQMASVPSVVMAQAIVQFVTPIAFARAGLGADPDRLRASAAVTRLGVVVMSTWIGVNALAAWWLGEGVLVLFTSEAYRGAGRLLPLLVLGLGLMQLGHLLGLIPMAYNRLRVHLGLKIAHSVVAIVLNVLGAALGGLTGVSISGVVSGAVYLGALWWNGRRITREARVNALAASATP